jgi:glycosyltransferase involved in cell wall biosynthesis
MKENILLTVAIPTYNRSKTLEKIILQLGEERNQDFIILISDDNSSDKTLEMVKKYQKSMSNLIYHKNSKNLGFSENVFKLYELTKTQYVWFLCDDDTPLSDSIGNILRAIGKYEPVVALFNCTWVNSYGQKLTSGVKKDIFFKDLNEFTDYGALMRLGYLSINVFRKKDSLDFIKKTAYKDNVFFQITLALLLLSKEFRFLEVSKSIVNRNVGFKYGDFFKFNVVDVLKAVFIVPHKFDNNEFVRQSKRNAFLALQLYLSQKLGLFRFDLEPTTETKQKILKYYGLLYGYFFLSLPFFKRVVPAFILRRIYLIKLLQIHGSKRGREVYEENIDRAYKDLRKTKFTAYK